MGGAEDSLRDYTRLLEDPAIFPNIADAGWLATPFMSVIAWLLAVAGIIAVGFLVLRIAVDVLKLTGVFELLRTERSGGGGGEGQQGPRTYETVISKIEGLGSGGNLSKDTTVTSYLTQQIPRILGMLILVGLLISGQIMPLAANLTAFIGGHVANLTGVDIETYSDRAQDYLVEEIDFSGGYTAQSRELDNIEELLSGLHSVTFQTHDMLEEENFPGSDEMSSQILGMLREHKELFKASAKQLNHISDDDTITGVPGISGEVDSQLEGKARDLFIEYGIPTGGEEGMKFYEVVSNYRAIGVIDEDEDIGGWVDRSIEGLEGEDLGFEGEYGDDE